MNCETCLGCGRTGWVVSRPADVLTGQVREVAATTIANAYPEHLRDQVWEHAGPCTACDGSGVEPGTEAEEIG